MASAFPGMLRSRLVSSGMLSYLKSMRDEPKIMNGVMLGGKQAVDWLRNKTPPVRWAVCFSEGLARLAEERDRGRDYRS